MSGLRWQNQQLSFFIIIDKPFGQRLIKFCAFPKMSRSSHECIEWLKGLEKLKVVLYKNKKISDFFTKWKFMCI